jgi:L-ascorbate metabolism protein UlaG (beta-lactamase superfamily)
VSRSEAYSACSAGDHRDFSVKRLGHATFKVTAPQNKVILIDPWIEGNPKSPAEATQLDKVDLILVTHGHSDHINDVVPTAQKFHAQVVAMVETGD